jgi:Tfp pilus assembly protein PilF
MIEPTHSPLVARLRQQCDGPRDGALLRFSLGNALLNDGDAGAAVDELRRAVDFDPAYSAALKLLGKACLAHDDPAAAAEAWRRGIAAASQRGDKQAEKEMSVFLRRLEKPQP